MYGTRHPDPRRPTMPIKGDKTSRVLEGKPEKVLQESGGRADECQQDVGIDGIMWRRQFLS